MVILHEPTAMEDADGCVFFLSWEYGALLCRSRVLKTYFQIRNWIYDIHFAPSKNTQKHNQPTRVELVPAPNNLHLTERGFSSTGTASSPVSSASRCIAACHQRIGNRDPKTSRDASWATRWVSGIFRGAKRVETVIWWFWKLWREFFQVQVNFDTSIGYHRWLLLMKTSASMMLVVLIRADSMLIWCVGQLLEGGTAVVACEKKTVRIFWLQYISIYIVIPSCESDLNSVPEFFEVPSLISYQPCFINLHCLIWAETKLWVRL